MITKSVGFLCGCTMEAVDATQAMWEMSWCPMHKAAPETLQACRTAADNARELQKFIRDDERASRGTKAAVVAYADVIQAATEAAIASAEPDHPRAEPDPPTPQEPEG